MSDIKTVAIVGTGVIGSGWAARCLARGLHIIATDPAPGAERKLRQSIERAWPAAAALAMTPGTEPGTLKFVDSVEEAVGEADFVQENAPEREDLKRALHARIDAVARPEVLIASSSSGLLPTALQADCVHPERVVIGHPFNPVYLLPLVEIVPGQSTAPDTVDRAAGFYESLGMYPLRLRKEIEGYLSDRLQEAVWREILHLVNDGVASTAELDDAIVYGPGLRWAFMGTCLTFHLAGGDDGMRHMLEQFGPALKLPWTRLVAPELNDTLIDRMVEGTHTQAAGRSIEDLERLRDDCLIDILRVLRRHETAGGRVLAATEARRVTSQANARWQDGATIGTPLRLHSTVVQAHWTDRAGDMSQRFFAAAFAEAVDALLRFLGAEVTSNTTGAALRTVECHELQLAGAEVGEHLDFTTQILDLAESHVHLFLGMYSRRSGKLLCTSEQRLVHVEGPGRTPVPIVPEVQKALAAVFEAHRAMEAPEKSGRLTGGETGGASR